MSDTNITAIPLEKKLILNEGLTITTKDGMGRVAVAMRDFGTEKFHHAIIREAPSLVWSDRDFGQFLLAFKRADSDAQKTILDMYHPPLSTPHVVELGTLASALAYLRVYQDVAFIHKLLAIAATNGHQYYGEPIAAADGDLRQHEMLRSSEAPKTALFLFGSKIAHSCQPNLSYTSKTQDGALEYKVIRPIATGDLTQCKCPDCGVQDGMERKEEAFIHRLEHLTPRRAEEPLRPLQDLVEDAALQLSPSHHVTIKALDMLARLGASKAENLDVQQRFMGIMGGLRMNPHGLSTTELRKIAAEAGLRAVVASECVAAGCHGCYSKSFQAGKELILPHDSVYEVGIKIFHVSVDLIVIPEAIRPCYSSKIVERYLPIMRGHFGDDDLDIQLIEDKLVTVTPKESIASGVTQATPRKNNQKTRRSTKKKKNKKGRR
ncbi:hypothetical protein IV203_023377 [Nitzschia inconspicua]|uniref:SET domain-containing protein n=1 Tax=Nitzschia inconspicua TaxID=303405 RepID=A0A9K3PC11_9STRA|nr:hypothetical protein IV203_023377 [Nitzschia inconspicua]